MSEKLDKAQPEVNVFAAFAPARRLSVPLP